MIAVYTVPSHSPTTSASNKVAFCVNSKDKQKALSKALAECREKFPLLATKLICTHEPIEFHNYYYGGEPFVPEDFNHDLPGKK